MQRLRAAHDCGQRLDSGPDEVYLRLLRGQGHTGCVGVETHPLRAFVFRAEALLHLASPDATGGAELGDLFKKVVVAVEEKGKAGGELVHIQPALLAPTYILEPIRKREGELLNCR